MQFKARPGLCLLAACVVLQCAATYAATITWTGASSATWINNSAANWSALYTNAVDDVVFDDSGANTAITVSGVVAPVSMFFNNSSVSYSLNTAAVSGTTGLTKSGTGTVTLNVNNTFSGKTILNGGVLSIAADGRLGTAPGSVVADQLTFNGGTLQTTAAVTIPLNRGITVNGGGATFDVQTGVTLFNGNISGAGGVLKIGAGTLALNQPLSSPNTVAGQFEIQAGVVRVDTGSIGIPVIGTANPVAPGGFLVQPGARLDYNRGGNQTWVDNVTLNGGTVSDLQSTNNYMNGHITLTANSIINKPLAFWRLDNGMSGAGGFEKVGGGQLIFNSAMTYAGPTTVTQGILTVNAISSLGTTNALTVQNLNTGAGTSVLLTLSNAAQTVGPLSGMIATPVSGVNTATIALASNHDLTINQTANGTYQGIITGTNAEVILGASSTSALTFTGANTYTGGTRINGGMLVVNNTTGSGTGTGAVTVNNTGALGGTGTITTAGLVDVNNGAMLAPGSNGTGTLTLNGAGGLALDPGSTYAVEIAGSGAGQFDSVNVAGTANIGGLLDVSFIGGSLGPNASIVILTANALLGTFSNAPTEGSKLTFDGVTFSVSYLNNMVTLYDFQVPEPSSLLLMVGVLGSGVLRRKKALADNQPCC